VSGKRSKVCSRVVFEGDVIGLAELVERSEPALPDFAWGDRILLEDEHLVAVDKPWGMPSQPTHDPTRESVVVSLEAWMRRRDQRPAGLKLAHRLDRDTSGVLVLGRTADAIAALGKAFAARGAQKGYLALVRDRGAPHESRFTVDNHLAASKRLGGLTLMQPVRSGGDHAITDFELLARGDGFAWVVAHPHTGRMHQIRAHLSGVGLPILGDLAYGGPSSAGGVPAMRCLLHAWRLSLRHPLTGASMRLEARVPDDMARFGTPPLPPWAEP
jgi:23S rRNA pseudouridine1911/1915/1917 synthase